MSSNESVPLYECMACHHLYMQDNVSCDCNENPQHQYRKWTATPDEPVGKVVVSEELKPEDLTLWVYTPEEQGSWAQAMSTKKGVGLCHRPTGLLFLCHEGPNTYSNRQICMDRLKAALKDLASKSL